MGCCNGNTIIRPERQYPPLATQVKSASGAAKRYVFSYIKGEPVHSMPELEARRVKICESCPRDQFNAESRRCWKCACWIDIKAGIRDEHCDLGEW